MTGFQPISLPHVKISLAEGPEAAHAALLGLCNEAFGWGLTMQQVQFDKIAGGITNILVKVTPLAAAAAAAPAAASAAPAAGAGARQPQPCAAAVGGAQPPPPVAVKVFGDKTELLVERDAETAAVVALAEQGFGAQVLALFGNGRVEQFLHCVTMTPPQMADPAFVPRIAALLARLHAAAVPLPRSPSLFPTIRRWLAMAASLEFPAGTPKAEGYARLDFAALGAEVECLEAVCARAASPVVFGHNDLLSGNLLVLQRPGFDPGAPDLGGPLTVIDFEYGAFTFRGFDWGNHFNEYAGFECDYSRYPSRERQALFFSHYFGVGGAPADLTAQQLDALWAEADLFALASHIYWGVWAVVQARYSPIDFDYLGYHHLRLGEYRRRKGEVLARAADVFGRGGGGGGGASKGNGAAGLRQELAAV